MARGISASKISGFLLLTKPGIVLLVLITTLGGMYIANRQIPSEELVFWTLLGTGLASAGSASLNQYLDKDIDALMLRTMSRPIVSGLVSAYEAFVFGSILLFGGFFILLSKVNATSAALALSTGLYYVLLYTYILKRKTALATELGGIAGAMPPVIGYSAVEGLINREAFALFIIMFLWQPAHFWALSIKYLDDYKRANIPIMALTKGIEYTKIKSLIYVASLLPATLTLFAFGTVGEVYFWSSLLLSLFYLILCVLWIFKKVSDMFLFFYSVFYLTSLFSALVMDVRR
ncbi:MAG: heme o synthase [Aquificaceae bacterium]|nr:heme o synthase [Aquificaceae bacterium]MDW8237202.1 heme o synthase [Aquificaceae bacterium]